MKKSGVVTVALVAALSAFSIMAADAREPGWYLGGGVGMPDSDDPAQKNASTGHRLFGGYDFTGPFSAELAYVNLGKFDNGGGGGSGIIPETWKYDGFQLSVLASHSIGKSLSLFGKLGAYAWQGDFRPASFLFSPTENGVSGSAGIGLRYMATRNIGIRVELEHFADVWGSVITMPSVSVLGHF